MENNNGFFGRVGLSVLGVIATGVGCLLINFGTPVTAGNREIGGPKDRGELRPSSCVVSPPGLVGWWKGDGNSLDSLRLNNGATQNGASYLPGRIGEGLNFDGIDDIVTVPDSPSVSFTKSFSIDAWVYLRSRGGEFEPIVSKWQDLGLNKRSYALAVFNTDGRLRLYASQNGSGPQPSNWDFVESATAVPLNTFVYVAGTFDSATRTAKVFLNGVESGSKVFPFSTVFDTEEALKIGAGDLGSNGSDYLNGIVDEAAVYDRALTPAEIASVFGAENNGKCPITTPFTVTVLPYGSSGYRYSVVPNTQTPPTDFGSLTFDDSTWEIGQAAFGNGTGSKCVPPIPLRTSWSGNSRLLTRKSINLPSRVSNVKLAFSVDNNIEKVLVNGVQVPYTFNSNNCAVLNASFVAIPQNLIRAGENLVAVQAFDFGFPSFFDMRLAGDFGPLVRGPGVADFDGDSKTDVSIFRPSNGQWWLNRSTDGLIVHAFGNSSDKLVPDDFTGDGKTDVAIWRSGEWFVLRSEDSSFYSFPFGTAGDVSVPGDYDGDGKADAAVFRPSNSTWYVQRSSGGTTIDAFGAAGDRPVQADYDGDGKTDIAIFRPGSGQWWLKRSTAGVIAVTFGNSSDKNVPGDYTGDGKADIAIWRPSTGEWFVLRSENSTFYSYPFGSNGDTPAPGDYDGDGKFDAAVYRGSNSTWYLNRSTAGVLIQTFGATNDIPVPSVTVQ